MIVRILADNQYRLEAGDIATVRSLDDRLVQAMESNDTTAFQTTLTQLVQFVQQQGTLVPMEEVVPSDEIIPAPDMTLTEARNYMQRSEAHAIPREHDDH